MTIRRSSGKESDGSAPAVDPVLDDILVCPACRGPLEARDSCVPPRDENRTGSRAAELACVRCRVAFVVEGGIPTMVMGRARRL